MGKGIVKKIEAVVGPENVTTEEFELIAYSRDWSYDGPLKPDIIVNRCSSVMACLRSSIFAMVRPGKKSRTG